MVSLNIAAALASLDNQPVLFVETQYSDAGFAKKVPAPGNGLSELLDGSEEAAACERIRQLSIAELLAESIRRIHGDESIGQLFMD